MNTSKTELYFWGVTNRPTHINWQGTCIPFLEPFFKYLGHWIIHPALYQQACAHLLTQVTSDLARYRNLPLNAWEKVQLVNIVQFPKWTYQWLFLLEDNANQHVDKLVQKFVLESKGMEQMRHTLKLPTPVKQGGMGLHQFYWAVRTRLVAAVQHELRDTMSPL